MKRENRIGFEWYETTMVDYSPLVKIENKLSQEVEDVKYTPLKKEPQVNIKFQDENKLLLFKAICKKRSWNMSAKIRTAINEMIDKELNEKA